MKKIVIYALFVLIVSSCQRQESNDKIVTILDMRYTLTGDLSKQQDIEEAWDHMHSISTIQGIVTLLFLLILTYQFQNALKSLAKVETP